MTPRPNISIFISRLAFSLLLCLAATTISAQGKLFALQKDSIPLFRGFSVSVDIAGPIVKSLGDYGEYEAALRLNLHDQYFPVFELGYGEADRLLHPSPVFQTWLRHQPSEKQALSKSHLRWLALCLHFIQGGHVPPVCQRSGMGHAIGIQHRRRKLQPALGRGSNWHRCQNNRPATPRMEH